MHRSCRIAQAYALVPLGLDRAMNASTGPCWVRTAPGTAGPGWARAVTPGERESQVTRPSTAPTSTAEAGRRWVRIPPPQRPRTRFGTPRLIGLVVPCRPSTHHRPRGLNTQRAGVPMPVTRDSAYIGGCPWPRPRQGPPKQGDCRAGLACRGQPAGVSLPAKVRDAERRCPHERSVPGPRLVTCHRSRAVRNGLQRYVVSQVASGVQGKQAPGQNPDKDEVSGNSGRFG
jgi:hypothetical protein